MVKGGHLNMIPAIDVVVPLADNQTFSGQLVIDSDNAITKDRPRLTRTILNATIVLLHCDN